MKFNRSVLSIILYVFSAILAIYSIWAFIQSCIYISQMIADGELVIKGNVYDIVAFFISSSIQYMATAAISFALGRLLLDAHDPLPADAEFSDMPKDEDLPG